MSVHVFSFLAVGLLRVQEQQKPLPQEMEQQHHSRQQKPGNRASHHFPITRYCMLSDRITPMAGSSGAGKAQEGDAGLVEDGVGKHEHQAGDKLGKQVGRHVGQGHLELPMP